MKRLCLARCFNSKDLLPPNNVDMGLFFYDTRKKHDFHLLSIDLFYAVKMDVKIRNRSLPVLIMKSFDFRTGYRVIPGAEMEQKRKTKSELLQISE